MSLIINLRNTLLCACTHNLRLSQKSHKMVYDKVFAITTTIMVLAEFQLSMVHKTTVTHINILYINLHSQLKKKLKKTIKQTLKKTIKHNLRWFTMCSGNMEGKCVAWLCRCNFYLKHALQWRWAWMLVELAAVHCQVWSLVKPTTATRWAWVDLCGLDSCLNNISLILPWCWLFWHHQIPIFLCCCFGYVCVLSSSFLHTHPPLKLWKNSLPLIAQVVKY